MIVITWTLISGIVSVFVLIELIWFFFDRGHFYVAYYTKLISNYDVISEENFPIHSIIIFLISLVPIIIVVSVCIKVKSFKRNHPLPPVTTTANQIVHQITITDIENNNGKSVIV